MLILIWSVAILVALVLYIRQKYARFSKYGVKNLKPVFPFGNMGRITLRMEHFADLITRVYESFPGERFVGNFQFMSPVVVIRDIELVKKVIIKDFEYFLDHRMFIDENSDPIFGRNLLSLKGQEWKDMRSTLSPAFTSSKMRLMVPFMVEIGEEMINSLKTKIIASGIDQIDIDGKDLTSRYANDVIASCAFGLKVNSHKDTDNEFYAMGKAASTFDFRKLLKIFASSSMPAVVTKALKMTLFSEEIKSFFKNLVLETMKDRETRNIIRPDMINLLMEAKKGNLTHDDNASNDADAGFATVEESVVGKKEINRVWTDNDLVAQAVLFFIAGFETVSTTMAFLLYEMAVNPDVQERLAREIREDSVKNGGKFDYNSIQNLTYLDMVVSEILRIWSPTTGLDRICIKDYNLGRHNDEATQDFIIRKGEGVLVPFWAFHFDPEYFPNPHKFDPERFSEENKHNIKPFTYMPFGLGPRNCIGSRFALCEVKIMVYQLLQHFEVSPCEKTCIPAKLATDTFNISIKGGHWIRLKIRK